MTNQGGVALKKNIGLRSGLLLVAISLCGCASATDMPDKKEAIIVDYMVNAVLQHNNNMDYDIKEKPVVTLPPKVTVPPKATEEPKATVEPDGTKNPASDDSGEKPISTPAPSDITTDNPAVVLGISGIGMEIKDYEIHKSYSSGDYFTLEPEEGKNLMMVNISLVNNTSTDKKLSLTAQMVNYEIEINDKDTYNPLLTVLDNDMLYLERNMSAGATEQAILVFQIDKNTNIEKVKFSMENKKEKYAQELNIVK